MYDNPYFSYKGVKTGQISFPLGGIGTGSIGLAGNGALVDWEIFNRPSKGTRNGFSHFAVKAEHEGKTVGARVLNSDLQPPFTGAGSASYSGVGFGPDRNTMAGVPHFRDCDFHGEFPFAKLDFGGSDFPGKLSLEAFNPFIPLNDGDSSLPAAFFTVAIENDTEYDLDYTVAATLKNPFQHDASANAFFSSSGVSAIKLSSGEKKNTAQYGDITIATDSTDVSYQENWFRGSWFDNLGIFWREFTFPGALKNRNYGSGGKNDHATLAARIKISAGKKGRARFIIAWNSPNAVNYWNPPKEGECGCQSGCCCSGSKDGSWLNYYATRFGDSAETALYSLREFDRLYGETKLFHDALFATTLPDYCLDAVSANISILKTPTCLRLTDGSFYAF